MQAQVFNHHGEAAEFDLLDRGLAYGDGVFETILVHQGQCVWWPEHWQRLCRGAETLGLPIPNEVAIARACMTIIGNKARAVLKILYTRGSGGRGYAIPAQLAPRIIVSLHAAPEPLASPICLRWCNTRLAVQPALAGIKHLNRLEQVLARSEWQSADIHEGLMCDTDGRVICATSGNIFIRKNGLWRTPVIDRCGIAGIARQWLLQNITEVETCTLYPDDIMAAEAVFICNAIRGIMPVQSIDERRWAPHPESLALHYALANAEPAFVLGD